MTETLLGKFRVMISLVHTLPDEPEKLLPICDVMYAVCHLNPMQLRLIIMREIKRLND